MQQFPPFFALSSRRPANCRHFYMGDYDCSFYLPPDKLSSNEWLIQSSPGHYHIFDFSQDLNLTHLVAEMEVRFCDRQFIKMTKKRGFAQLCLKGLLMQKGSPPKFRLRLVYVTKNRDSFKQD